MPNAFFVSAKRRLTVGRLGDVGLDGDGFAAVADDFGDDAVGAFLAGAVIDDDGGASAARCWAIRRPIPLDAPVTTATFPASFLDMIGPPQKSAGCKDSNLIVPPESNPPGNYHSHC